MQEKVRIQYIDIVAGILILWMIIQHALFHAWAIDPNYSYSRGWNPNMWFPYLHFFMPWFFYKSGAFFHKRTIKDLWHLTKLEGSLPSNLLKEL